MTGAPRIRTTLVGSYPAPDWLRANPSEQALTDATRVVLHTQERAGIDVVCDGELYRFDVNHPETNGMIDWFVRPLAGMRTAIGWRELQEYRRQRGMGFRGRPPAVCEAEIGAGVLDLVSPCARARALAGRPLKFTLTGPHMLAKTVLDRHYGDPALLADALAGVLAEQVAELAAEVIQLDEANCPAIRRSGRGRRARSTGCSMRSGPRPRSICASATTAARWSRRAAGPSWSTI